VVSSDTLAFVYIFPPIGAWAKVGLSSTRMRPCWAHQSCIPLPRDLHWAIKEICSYRCKTKSACHVRLIKVPNSRVPEALRKNDYMTFGIVSTGQRPEKFEARKGFTPGLKICHAQH